MKLLAAQIKNYRSIVDSGKVEIDDSVTVIIGKNEQGKTNFLKGLQSFNKNNSYGPNDLPNHLRAHLEEEDSSIVQMISLWLSPCNSERQELKNIINSTEKIKEFKVTRFYDDHYEYYAIDESGEEKRVEFAPIDNLEIIEKLKKETGSLNTKLVAHSTRLPAFAASNTQAEKHITQFITSDFEDQVSLDNVFNTFLTALKSLPQQDVAIQNDIATATKNIGLLKTELLNLYDNDLELVFQNLFPHFVFHSTTLDSIPNEVSVSEFTKDPEGTSKGMASLCKVAGLSTQKITSLVEGETQEREVYEDHYRASISGGINEFWRQQEYNIHFRIEKAKLSVSISDNKYAPRIVPSDRSDGFQWYLSFYCSLLSEVKANDPFVLLLDNPGLELHADGQRDIKRFLQEKLPKTTQVIYVTHSPAMIDTYNLEQVRCVELKSDNQGTKVSKLSLDKDQLDLLEPVRSAIGASLVDTLMMNKFNILVEGAADKPILEGIFSSIAKEDQNKFTINGSISETGLLLPQFYEKTGLPYIVFLDSDDRGRQLKSKLTTADISESKLILLGDIIKRDNDFELEDLFSSKFYRKAVNETYPNFEKEDFSEQTERKRTKQYEIIMKEKLNIGFNKRRVGETLKRMLNEDKIDKESKKNFETVVNKILEILKQQTSSSTNK